MAVPKKKKVKKVTRKKAIKKVAKPKKRAVKKTTKRPTKRVIKRKKTHLDLKKPHHNPIIGPTDNPWESKAAFNPTAIEHDGKVHIIYRAIGDSDMSVLGYAKSDDGLSVSERHPDVAFFHHSSQKKRKRPPMIPISSGGGWGGGCEDPRMTKLEDDVYLFYTAFDGWGSLRIAMTSISLDDFISKKWKWSVPVHISPPGEYAKNWALFPEKINGKFAILHSIAPDVLIEYVDDMDEFDGETRFIKSISHHDWVKKFQMRGIRGAGPAPIKTKYGWLVLYHAMEESDPGKYKLWAMMLDDKDPTKVLYRSKHAILEPDEHYENDGFKWGVIYACGAVVKDGHLFVYYGGADRVSCVASANLDKFLGELVKHKEPKLKKKAKLTFQY